MAEESKPSRRLGKRLPRIRFQGGGGGPVLSASNTFYFVLVPSLALGAFGPLMTFSASSVTYIQDGMNPYSLLLRTGAIAALSLALGWICMRMPIWVWNRLSILFFVAALSMQVLLIPFGIAAGGHVSWLPIPGTGQAIQPSEFLKLATCLVLARFLSGDALDTKDPKKMALAVGIPTVLAVAGIMLGDDMGTALIFFAIAAGAAWMAGFPLRWFGYSGLAVVAFSVFFVAAASSRVRRVMEFLPWSSTAPSTSAPTQTDHGLWALGSGGLVGLGPGASREKWNYLQEAHTDFVFAIIGEEFGLLGTLTILGLFAALIFGIFQISANTSSGFVRVASGALGAGLLAQGLINVGTVVGLVPVIGVPFPLVSYGGSSFLFTALSIGVLLSFARYDVSVAASTEKGNA